MITIKVTGSSYPMAHELPVSRSRPAGKRQKSPGGNGGGDKGKNVTSRFASRLSGRTLTEAQNTDRKQTEAHKRVLLISGGKRRFITQADYGKL